MAKFASNSMTICLTGITANSTEIVPAGYALGDVFIQETAGNAVTGGIKIGTSNGGTEIATSISVSASSFTRTPVSSLNSSGPFSASLPQTIYIQAVTGWNGASIKIVILLVQAAVFTPTPIPNSFLTLVGDGDSITATGSTGGITTWLDQQAKSTVHVDNVAVSASAVDGLVGRASIVDGLATSGSALVALIGANDMVSSTASQFTDSLAAYIAARLSTVPSRPIICCTVLPRTLSGFNAKRNAANTTIRSWLGTRCAYLIDFAADPTIGGDSAASNTTYYQDGLHPTQAGQNIMASIASPVISAVPYN